MNEELMDEIIKKATEKKKIKEKRKKDKEKLKVTLESIRETTGLSNLEIKEISSEVMSEYEVYNNPSNDFEQAIRKESFVMRVHYNKVLNILNISCSVMLLLVLLVIESWFISTIIGFYLSSLIFQALNKRFDFGFDYMRVEYPTNKTEVERRRNFKNYKERWREKGWSAIEYYEPKPGFFKHSYILFEKI